jgi:hypothetical protein
MIMVQRKMFLVLLGIALVCQAQAVELLTNGNLNDYTGTLGVNGSYPNGWTLDIQTPASAWFQMQNTFSPDGSPVATMYVNQAGPGVYLRQTVSFEPNSISNLYFSSLVNTQWYSSNNWGDAIVELTYSEPNGRYISYDEFVILSDNQYPAPTTWTTYSHVFAVPPGAGKAELALHGSDWIKGLYWDNVSLSYTGQTQAELVYPGNMSSVSWEDRNNCGNGPTLHWNSAEEAIGVHYVYLGTSEERVAGATMSDPEFLGTVPLTDPNFVLSLSDVVKGQKYYWRVDQTTSIGIVQGETIWSFTISPFTNLDLFEYASDAELQAVWGAGAVLNNNAMQIDYDNSVSPYYVEATADAGLLGCQSDWTRGGNQMLVLDVKGHDNMAESVFVTLESNDGAQSGTVQYPLVAELNQQADYEWFHFWPIAFETFADQGVQMTQITKITIGVGFRSNPVAGGAGSVLIDNLRLSSPMCLRGYTPADINRDCVVDIYDFVQLSNHWLQEEYLVTAQAPARNPVLWYTFDEGSGNTVIDSSGFGYHGSLNFEGVWGGAGSGINGSDCLYLGNSTYVQVPVAAANIGDPNYPSPEESTQYLGAESTISLWLKDPGQTDTDSELFQIGLDGEVVGNWVNATGKFQYKTAGGNTLLWSGSRRYSASDLYTNPQHPQDQWVHYAFVKSYSAGLMRIYQNGRLVAEGFADGDYSPAIDGIDSFFSIGAWRWSGGDGGYMDGWIDDFRVYDYALSDAEVLFLAVEGGAEVSPMLQPLILDSNIVADGRIDLQDLAQAAELWLQDVVFP